MVSYIKQEGVFLFSKHNLFTTWRMMNVRCYDERHKAFHRYGGRGISVCIEWRWDNPWGFFNFISDVGTREDGMTLDRIDPNGNYCKENCRWATKRVQQNNIEMYDGIQVRGNRLYTSISIHGIPTTVGIFALEDEGKAKERYLLIKEMKFSHTDDEIMEFVKTLDDRTPKDKRQYGRKTSKYYGVSWNKDKKNWRAAVPYRDSCGKLKQKWLGAYGNEEDAFQAVKRFLGEGSED